MTAADPWSVDRGKHRRSAERKKSFARHRSTCCSRLNAQCYGPWLAFEKTIRNGARRVGSSPCISVILRDSRGIWATSATTASGSLSLPTSERCASERNKSPPTPRASGSGMNIELPLYRQEKPNTCGLACLRMVLSAYGTDLDETTLEGQARLVPGGMEIGELERLARQFGIDAEIRELAVEQFREVLAMGSLAIAYVDRAVFDLSPASRLKHSLRAARIHTVIPRRLTAASVIYHDPLPPRISRKSIRLFRLAYESLGGRSIVCSKAGDNRL